jgi:hypothetical protein
MAVGQFQFSRHSGKSSEGIPLGPESRLFGYLHSGCQLEFIPLEAGLA